MSVLGVVLAIPAQGSFSEFVVENPLQLMDCSHCPENEIASDVSDEARCVEHSRCPCAPHCSGWFMVSSLIMPQVFLFSSSRDALELEYPAREFSFKSYISEIPTPPPKIS